MVDLLVVWYDESELLRRSRIHAVMISGYCGAWSLSMGLAI